MEQLATVESVVDKSVATARTWLNTPVDESHNTASEQLAGLMRDPSGVKFTMNFVDRAARPEDHRVGAREMRKLTPAPAFLGMMDQLLFNIGALASNVAPDVVMPIAIAYMRKMAGHLVLDADGDSLQHLLDDAASKDIQLNLNLLGEAVLGNGEAANRAQRTIDLINNPRVTYVSVKASSLCAQLNHFDIDGSVERLKEALRPIYRAARDSKPSRTFVNLDMEEYRDLDLTIRLFTELLSEDEFKDYKAGIVLQAYLPDSTPAFDRLASFARQRVDNGGAPIKIRFVKGANLSIEKVDAEMHCWPQTPYMVKDDVDANYIRLLDHALSPEYADAVHIGVASHNLYTSAVAYELAKARGVLDQVDAEMLQGMSPEQSTEVHKAFGSLILYTPVVRKEDFDVAVSYLVRRLEENAAPQNFIHAFFDDDPHVMKGQELRFLRAVGSRDDVLAGTRRTQDRTKPETEAKRGGAGMFDNEPDTDFSLGQNREWGLDLLKRYPGAPKHAVVTDPAEVDAAMKKARAAGREWAKLTGPERADVLDVVAQKIREHRADLIAVAAFEAGKTVAETDPEVSEATDFARYYAESARVLGDRHSEFTPHELVAVIPPWNFPVAIPAGGMLAALAAGSGVAVKPAPQVVRCAEVVVDAIHEALTECGINTDVLTFIRADESDAGRRIVESADSIILTGASETAKLFRSWNPRLAINAETSGKNAIIVTPSADPDLAVADVLHSAFGHSGQKCSAASLVILVGSMGCSKRFLNQLIDAVETLHVGVGTDPSTKINGLIEPPGDKLERGLTRLDRGEKWLVKPEKLNDEGTLWSPGVRCGVEPGSWFHTHECFGPVLGIMRADGLDQAIEWQNSTGFGLTGGIHTLADDEIDHWVDKVEVGNAYVNRGITGAIVRRQSFGGWKNSSIGRGAKAGGPNYVAQQGTWSDGNIPLVDASVRPDVARGFEQFSGLIGQADRDWLQRALRLDALAWDTEFGIEHDRSALACEANVFRYRPLLDPLQVRVSPGFKTRDLVRTILGAQLVGTDLEISTALSSPEIDGLREAGVEIATISDEAFAEKFEGLPSERVRVLGTADERLFDAAVASGGVVLDSVVLADGRLELLHFLLEQALSVTTHRFGVLDNAGRFGGKKAR